MKMNTKLIWIVVVTLILLYLLGSCGNDSSNSTTSTTTVTEPVAEPVATPVTTLASELVDSGKLIGQPIEVYVNDYDNYMLLDTTTSDSYSVVDKYKTATVELKDGSKVTINSVKQDSGYYRICSVIQK